jgi:hypothetical protein
MAAPVRAAGEGERPAGRPEYRLSAHPQADRLGGRLPGRLLRNGLATCRADCLAGRSPAILAGGRPGKKPWGSEVWVYRFEAGTAGRLSALGRGLSGADRALIGRCPLILIALLLPSVGG